jgi:signal transduction histidine kinase
MTKLASRIAGGRLFAILAILLIPMLLMGYLTMNRLSQDIRTTQAQLKGLAIVQQALPLMVERASGKIDVEKARLVIDNFRPFAASVNAEAALEQFEKQVLAPTPSSLQASAEMSRFFEEVGTKSELTLNLHAEGHALALAAVSGIPQFIVEVQGLAEGVKGSVMGLATDEVQNRKVVWASGRLQASADVLSESLHQARKASSDAGIYYLNIARIAQIRAAISELTKVFVKATQNDSQSVLKAVLSSRQDVAGQFNSAADLHILTGQRLNTLLQASLTDLQSRFRTLLALVIGCTALAIGGSLLLFMRTLKRLDEVETERLRAQAMGEKVNSINSDLATVNRELADKMARLKQAQDELIDKRRMEQLGQLTATIAHEIRNPLGSVRTSAFLLEKKLANKNLGVEQQIDRINKGVVRCDNIITQLLDYSRTKSVQSKPVKLDDWLETLVGEEAQRLPLKVEIECELGLGELEVPVDPARLQRAVTNLLNNASEAMMTEHRPAGDTRPFAIRVSTSIENDMIALRVQDTGPGISAENLAKVREPLFTTKSFGTGLGIPAIEQIAQQHGGRLDIQSELGHGATFTVYLPLRVYEAQDTQEAA